VYVVATAGHVDHGKSTLVRALTGMEPDRYAEERRRGMTIDLGFAWTRLPSGAEIAFVDVPGHARFVGTMLAGVGPIPAVLFVVAADEGWRQQSAEHLAALDAFGVRHGLLAVTRSDLADPVPATAGALAQLRGSGLKEVPAVAVSGATGAGLPQLRVALDALVARLPAPDPAAAVRLWVDRAFTIQGAGSVVTGTLGAGTLRVGDELLLLPSGRPVRVRGLESLQRRLPAVSAVARVAVNLRGVERGDLRRGQALVTPGAWLLTDTVDVRLSGPGDELAAQAMTYVGSAATPSRLRPLGGDIVRLTLSGRLPLRIGDRLVLRDPSRHDLLAGATVLDVAPPPLRRRGAAAARSRELGAADGRPDLADEVTRRGTVRLSELTAMGVQGDEARPAGVVPVGDWLISAERWQHWQSAARAAVTEQAARSPLDPSPTVAAVSYTLGMPDVALVAPLARAAGLIVERGRLRAVTAPSLPPAVEAALDTLCQRLDAEPFAAAEALELAAAELTPAVLAAAVRAGRLVALGEGIWLLPDWPEVAVRRLAALSQPFTVSQARQALGTTRRVAVPVLEALDAARRTRRLDGSHRVILGVG
jgi:selenocysteine-specific elongation factor